MRAEFLGDDGPAHEFGDGEEFEELGFGWDEGVAGVGLDAVEEVGLFVVVGREDNVEDYSLEDLWGWEGVVSWLRVKRREEGVGLRLAGDLGPIQRIQYRGLDDSACRHRDTYPRVLRG